MGSCNCTKCIETDNKKIPTFLNLRPKMTLQKEENITIISMLQLQDNRIVCGDKNGTIHIYEINFSLKKFSIISHEQKHPTQILSLCTLSNGNLISASVEELNIWTISSNDLLLIHRIPIAGDINKAIPLFSPSTSFAVGHLSDSVISLSLFGESSLACPYTVLHEQQVDIDSELCSMIQLKDETIVTSIKCSREGHLTFWNIHTHKTKHTVHGICTNASNGLLELPYDLIMVAANSVAFVILNVNSYEVIARIEEVNMVSELSEDAKHSKGEVLFNPQLITLALFRSNSVLFVSDGKFGQIALMGDKSVLLFITRVKGKFRGNGLIVRNEEKYVIVDNDAFNNEEEGAISLLEFDYIEKEASIKLF